LMEPVDVDGADTASIPRCWRTGCVALAHARAAIIAIRQTDICRFHVKCLLSVVVVLLCTALI
jgi:hypothetical protein